MTPGKPNIPAIHAFKTFIGIKTPKFSPITLIIIKKSPPAKLLIASLIATLIGQ